ncbi:hypothetical protein ACIBEJ_00710 [Nonomuraea sp. NPDC050790]|uniref:hypothetical protein n=1 Tax=Nonomuraea sp. NPDC050790 TaxID=3364371 RepID=UPI0037A19AB1
MILSYGLGVDSTAILLRWLLEPDSRDFDLDDLVVIVAQTGDEQRETGRLVEQYVFPLLRRYGVRVVQVARAGASDKAGHVVLDDTRQPYVCHLGGAYTLSAHMLAAGTVPQVGGPRRCSIRFKGWVLDRWVSEYTGGAPYDHAVGFELGELGRMAEDREQLRLAGRRPFYPLIEWGWHREQAEAYIVEHLGVAWIKSACTFCPFAMTSAAGRRRTVARYIANPAEAMLPLMMEHVAVALNPRQGLIGGERLADLLTADPAASGLLREFSRSLDEQQWALYEVRRAFRARKGNPMAMANAVRSLVRLDIGERAGMVKELRARARSAGATLAADGEHHRAWIRRRGTAFPCVEELLTIAPAVAADKVGPGFDEAWEQGLRGSPQLAICG